jgi:hypothetical protein
LAWFFSFAAVGMVLGSLLESVIGSAIGVMLGLLLGWDIQADPKFVWPGKGRRCGK